ncbi:hypothetical protein, partial [Candidatus Entotheonella palauensis]|uniref:hypothetical protein n=1 Tax=Candidatus Entotheonella palauensis TaxID=93172 RepID=UPI001C4E03C1
PVLHYQFRESLYVTEATTPLLGKKTSQTGELFAGESQSGDCSTSWGSGAIDVGPDIRIMA